MTGPGARPPGSSSRPHRVGAGRDAYTAGRDQYFDQHREIHLAEWSAGEPGMVSVEPLLGRLPQQVQGRDELVTLLARLVVNSSRCRVWVLHGMGGCGKSTVALAVARKVRGRGVKVWQVDASNAARLSAGMRQIASDLASGDQQFDTWIQRAWSGQGSAPDLLWRLLNAADEPWLLVVDQADEPQLLAAEGAQLSDGTGWLRPPAGINGLVLVTSRDGNSGSWGPWAECHQITPLLDDDAADLLVNLAGPSAGPRSDALRLAARLGGLPLALNLAGQDLQTALNQPFFSGEKVISSFAAYYDDLHERATRMTISAADNAAPTHRMLQIVTLTVAMSLDQIDRLGIEIARPLLILLSCYADAPIPTALLLNPSSLATSPLFSGLVPGQLRQALTALTDRNLINSYRLPDAADEALAHVVRLHPLIQDSNRGRLDSPEQGQTYLKLLIELLDHALVGSATSKDLD
ncbi:MAG: NB-ARC domain-containing protein, partial [Actinomycetota bacterium]|nr:NB-ARC domain-containing protein [Actinomycetota bacterium]